MVLQLISDTQKKEYNKLVSHVMQSWEWGEFRKQIGTKLKRYGIFKNGKLVKAFQITFHPIPFTKKFVGYFPKGPAPDKELVEVLKIIGKQENCAFIKLEPNIITPVIPANAGIQLEKSGSELDPRRSLPRTLIRGGDDKTKDYDLIPSPKPLFSKYNFTLDLTKSEEELLKNFHPKTRYNIKLAEKKGVGVSERTDDEAFEIYLKLYFETTQRQGYHGHNKSYHQKVWETLKTAGMARLLIATYQKAPLTAWMLLNFKDSLYYPYGGSSKAHPEVMSNNLVAWEAIKLGKKMGLKHFDMWGALGPNADPKNPWFGFHRFKQGYGGRLVEYIGTYDLVFDQPLYWMFTLIDKLMPVKVFLLKLLGK